MGLYQGKHVAERRVRSRPLCSSKFQAVRPISPDPSRRCVRPPLFGRVTSIKPRQAVPPNHTGALHPPSSWNCIGTFATDTSQVFGVLAVGAHWHTMPKHKAERPCAQGGRIIILHEPKALVTWLRKPIIYIDNGHPPTAIAQRHNTIRKQTSRQC